MKVKIIIDPLYNPLYNSFYIGGLIKKFGKQSICFSRKPFLDIDQSGTDKRNFNFVVKNNNSVVRYSIDTNDFNYINNQSSYDWCDIYGKVNTNWQVTPKCDFPKIVSLSPSFGVRIFNNCQTIFHLLNLLIFKVKPSETNIKKLLGQHKRLRQNRSFLANYENSIKINEGNYVFHLSTLWYSDQWNKNDENVNRIRANFIRICKNIPDLQFEGGLLPQEKGRSSEKLFEDVIYRSKSPMSISDYIEKTQKSLFVFNAPAFWNCHGWKLGEYLAMGKAIISAPLSNDLPAPLEHGKNIHFVDIDNEQELKDAILKIKNDKNYRKTLENGAKIYWQNYGTPEKSLELLGII